jgi:hypothetical protein
VPQGTIVERHAAMTPLRLHRRGVLAVSHPQGTTAEQCRHLHTIAKTTWVTILLYPTTAASELLLVNLLCVTLLNIDLVHTVVLERSSTSGGYNNMREATLATMMTIVVVAMA